MTTRTTSSRGALAALALAAMLGGCAVGPDFVRPSAPDADRYTSGPSPAATIVADGQAQRFDTAATMSAHWWQAFGSPALDDTVQRALLNSATLQAAEASLRQSEDNLHAGDGVFFPRLDAGLSATRERTAPIQQGSSAKGNPFDVVSLGGTVSYPLDLFGGERRAVEGLAAQVDTQRFESKAAYVTLSANVVDACIARAGYLAQVRSTQRLIALERDQLAGIEAQQRAGVAPYADVLTQRGLIAGNESLLAALLQKASQAEHLLALLQGTTPSAAALPDLDLDHLVLPLALPLSVPSDLVRQRPDILAAEAQLHAASANIGVATAAMFPSFDLTATYGAAGSGFGSLLAAGGRFWSLGPALAAPLFHGGSLWYGRQAAIEAEAQQRAVYRQTVLAAFAQVADTLAALQHDAQSVAASRQSRDAAGEALRLLQANYRAGLVAYTQVQLADVQFQQADIAWLQAVVARYQDTVALFAALGGGWWNAPDATTRIGAR
jgi:NodT family efflux transporter outer membrane factor (OMF) lipoprotein